MKLIMQEMGIGYDGSMPVGDKPIFLKNSEAHIAQKAIEDKLGCIMPTVYVSAPNNGQHNINSKGLAKRLSGMAHILVEPDADFSFDLKEKVRDINAYNGAVGIYWPGTMNRLFFVQRGKSPNTRKIENDVCQKVKDSLLTHRGIQECSWPFLLEIKSKLKMRELRETGSTKLDKYMELFDAELDAKKEELALAQKEIERLSRQVYSNTMTTPIPGTPILIRGSEEDKYKGECIDLLLDILNREVRNCEVGTRRRDIIEDLIASNSGNGEKKVILAQLKSLLHSYKKIDAKTRAGLEEIGFHLRENGGKHYKLNFRNEHRYTVVVSKTSSDHRTGRNTVQAISKKML
ncbi:hypothetical protein [uncultured Pseudodesulfovibrio sp.]|uniref:hypothetical protein n=1 Tax=uncultured Pseudodesulfovibrio sp. TaxID=2035858 RepID=UPI0029C7B447|nr:hypothetical protein [uncultured Pseudodesulfovibrio sp.]